MHSGLSDRPALPRTHVAIHYKKKKKGRFTTLLHQWSFKKSGGADFRASK